MSKSPENIDITPYEYLAKMPRCSEFELILNLKEDSVKYYAFKDAGEIDTYQVICCYNNSVNDYYNRDLIFSMDIRSIFPESEWINYIKVSNNFVDPTKRKEILKKEKEKKIIPYSIQKEDKMVLLECTTGANIFGQLEVGNCDNGTMIIFNEITYDDLMEQKN